MQINFYKFKPIHQPSAGHSDTGMVLVYCLALLWISRREKGGTSNPRATQQYGKCIQLSGESGYRLFADGTATSLRGEFTSKLYVGHQKYCNQYFSRRGMLPPRIIIDIGVKLWKF